MATIKDAIDNFNNNKERVVDFQNIIKSFINEDATIELPNDSFSHALSFTDLMLMVAQKEVRIFTGNFFETFVEPLKETIKKLLSRFSTKENAFVKVILVDSKEKGQAKFFNFLSQQEKEKIDIIRAAYSGDPTRLQHFMCVDSNIYRIESPHPELSEKSSEFAIKAKVCFNNEAVTQSYIQLFDRIWNKLKQNEQNG